MQQKSPQYFALSCALYVVVALLSAVFIVGPILELVAVARLKQNGLVTRGTVSEVVEMNNTEMSGIGFTVCYRVQGQLYTVQNRVLLPDTLYRVGQRLAVLYDREDPASSRIATPHELYAAWIWFILLGLSIVVSLLLFRKRLIRHILTIHPA